MELTTILLVLILYTIVFGGDSLVSIFQFILVAGIWLLLGIVSIFFLGIILYG
tara:strand:- start:181 stop:339 length:159 start_codon:yes stop_codon:yes gene_type:complete